MLDKIFYYIPIYVYVYIHLHTTLNNYLCAHLVHICVYKFMYMHMYMYVCIYGSFTYEWMRMYVIFLLTFYMIIYYDKLNYCLNVCVCMHLYVWEIFTLIK